MYTKESIEKLKEKINIYDVLDDILELEDEPSYECPFCESEHFLVDQLKDKCYCVDCKFHGDGIAMIMNVQKISFNEAIEILAKYYDFKLEKVAKKERKSVEEILKSVFYSALPSLQDKSKAVREKGLEELEILAIEYEKIKVFKEISDTMLFRRYEALRSI